MMIEALKKDGTPLDKGDSVLCIWDTGEKCVGKVRKVNGPRLFASLKNKTLQTYSIGCSDGVTRPAHAWHIKQIFKGFRDRKWPDK